VETKWFYEMINLMTRITGNVQLTSAENEGRSELDLFLKIDSKIPLSHWLYITFLWSIDESNKKVSLLTGLSLRTVITALQRLRHICSLKILHGNLKLGGQGKMIEIDKSIFGHKRKYNHGQAREQARGYGREI